MERKRPLRPQDHRKEGMRDDHFRRAAIGPPATIYRVERDHDGTILTYTVERQD